MNRFFVPRKNLTGPSRAVIEGQELAHMKKVLRLRPGANIVLFDDLGWEHEAVIRRFVADRAEIEITGSRQAERESRLHITLGLDLVKGEKADFIVEKATELGVQMIVPFSSTFAVPKLDRKKIQIRMERWQKIALSAVKQCGRTRVPEILPACDFRSFISEQNAGALKLLFWEHERQQSLLQVQRENPRADAVVAAVGPEGGFTAEEAALACAQSFLPVHLGRRILRSETAAVTALSLVQFLWGDLNEK
jgi:16S rRNA (uracil1498-N3)-methyltransferase